MRISLLSHDLSTSAVGRAHVLSRLLHTEHEVEIVGPSSTGEVWAPVADHAVVPLRVVPYGPLADMAGQADGDLLYAVKERPASLGVAVAARRNRPRPLIADVDDWELGFLLDDAQAMWRSRFRSQTKWIARSLVDVRQPNNPYATAWTQSLLRRADAITVASSPLSAKFRGTVIEQSRDLALLDPGAYDRDQVRLDLGIAPGQVVIVFVGSPRRHKGLPAVVEALDLLDRDNLMFLTVGGDPRLPRRPYLHTFGWQPSDTVTRFLAAADLVVLPQDDSPAGRTQMPGKLYDAMGMGLPVVVTDVGDLPAAADGCGLVVPAGDIAALAAAIATLADDPELRARLGAAGREKCVARFSDEAVRPRLLELVDRTAGAYAR